MHGTKDVMIYHWAIYPFNPVRFSSWKLRNKIAFIIWSLTLRACNITVNSDLPVTRPSWCNYIVPQYSRKVLEESMSKIDRIKALQDNTPQEIWSMNLLMRKVGAFVVKGFGSCRNFEKSQKIKWNKINCRCGMAGSLIPTLDFPGLNRESFVVNCRTSNFFVWRFARTKLRWYFLWRKRTFRIGANNNIVTEHETRDKTLKSLFLTISVSW